MSHVTQRIIVIVIRKYNNFKEREYIRRNNEQQLSAVQVASVLAREANHTQGHATATAAFQNPIIIQALTCVSLFVPYFFLYSHP